MGLIGLGNAPVQCLYMSLIGLSPFGRTIETATMEVKADSHRASNLGEQCLYTGTQ